METGAILSKNKKSYILQWWYVEGITMMIMNSLKKGDITSDKGNVLMPKLNSNYLESLLARTDWTLQWYYT